ncbi:hypothetical protein GOB57_09780 [Sinorhizobium meliloti]|nr:hypothetical protein [Sinorhizobium meliloti]
MALRKRSYGKLGADKNSGVTVHNWLVDQERAARDRKERKRRVNDVSRKLRGEGIDPSWAEEALRIMEEYGYGLNQLSTRVLPELRRRIDERAQEEARKRQEKLEKQARASRKRAEKTEVDRLRRVGQQKRRELTEALNTARADARLRSGGASSIDTAEVILRAKENTVGEIEAEINEFGSLVGNPSSAVHAIHGAVNQSLYFDYSRTGVFKCLAWTAVRTVVGLVLVVSAVSAAKGSAYESAVSVLAALFLLALPVDLIWNFVTLRRPTIKPSYPSATAKYRSVFYALGGDARTKLPKFRKNDLPDQLRSKLEDLNKGLRSAIRRPSN